MNQRTLKYVESGRRRYRFSYFKSRLIGLILWRSTSLKMLGSARKVKERQTRFIIHVGVRFEKFKGKTAVVTGAASGIGFGLAGAQEQVLIVLADIEEEALERAVKN